MIIHTFNDKLSDALVEELSRSIKTDKFIYPRKEVQFPIYSSYNASKSFRNLKNANPKFKYPFTYLGCKSTA